MIAFEIRSTDTMKPQLKRILKGLEPDALAKVAGRSGRNVVRDHFFRLNSERPNQLGSTRRTNYYAGAGKATQFTVQGDVAIISVNKVGISQRYYGGTIKPKTRKYLTIPVHPDAHGKRAGQFKGLILVFGMGGQPVALARPRFRPRKRGFIGPPVAEIGEVLYRLLRQVTQQPDPGVLPLPDQIYGGVIGALNDHIDRTIG